MENIDISAIANAALPRATSLVSNWFPLGRREGHEWVLGNIDGDVGDSLKVNTLTGKWSDFATGDAGGDLVSLLAARRRMSQLEAAKVLAKELGFSDATQPIHTPPQSVWQPIMPVPEDAPPPPDSHFKHGRPSARHPYHNIHGQLLFWVYRFDLPSGKEFTPVSFGRMNGGDPEWRFKGINGQRPLYNLHVVANNPNAVVVVCEGEKATEAAMQFFPSGEYVVVTSCGGANAAAKTDWQPLQGRAVIIWPDNDAAGSRYAAEVKQLALRASARVVDVVDFTPLAMQPTSEGWDAADAIAEGITSEKLHDFLAPAKTVSSESVKVRNSRNSPAKTNKPKESPFPDIEPWDGVVDGEVLADEIRELLKRHLALPAGSAEAICLWSIFTHGLDAFYHSPRLFFSSPEKQCGKSTALKIIHKLVNKAVLAANISPAAIYRMVDVYKPTLLLDEADTYMEKNEDLRGVLNSGHDRETATIVRCEGDKHEVKLFSTWACYAIAGIGRIPATLEDRSVIVHMRRRHPHEDLEKFRPDRAQHLEIIARKIRRWVDDNFHVLKASDPSLPKGLGDRACDNWTPLFAIADAIGGKWPAEARQAAIDLQSHELTDDLSIGVQLLADIKSMFDEKQITRLFSSEICEWLVEQEERPWGEWGWSKKPISSAQLARLLKNYAIRPTNIRMVRVAKGYERESFEEAWVRYLPTAHTPEIAATPLHATKRYRIPDENQPCSGVAAKSEGAACSGTSDSNRETFTL